MKRHSGYLFLELKHWVVLRSAAPQSSGKLPTVFIGYQGNDCNWKTTKFSTMIPFQQAADEPDTLLFQSRA
jgi:hypothetical protein